jgi:hypothetical protein
LTDCFSDRAAGLIVWPYCVHCDLATYDFNRPATVNADFGAAFIQRGWLSQPNPNAIALRPDAARHRWQNAKAQHARRQFAN